MSHPNADPLMVKRAKQRGAIWYQLDCGKEVVATLVCWKLNKARIEFVNGTIRTVPNDRVRPVL